MQVAGPGSSFSRQFMPIAQSNLWSHTAGAPLDAAPLAGDATADAVIIGGGFTGCSAALHLAEAGARAVLLEAGAVGDGGSGRNVGLVNAGLWLEPQKVEAALGVEAGARLNAILASGPDLVFALIEKHGMECEAIRAGTLHCAHSRSGLANLRERLRQYQARGWPVRLLSEAETRAKTGTNAFHGALLDSRAGTIQPLGYARGLARAAMAAGARIHERTPATAIAWENGRWRVTTPKGRITAEALLLATNAYHAPLSGAEAPRYMPLYWFQFATAPLGQVLREKILPERQGCWDTAMVMSSFRLDAAGRLIVGAVGSLHGVGLSIHHGWARRKLGALFPQAAAAPFEHGWHGRIAMTSDHIPKIIRLGPRALSIHGYSGRGIAPGTVFGKAAADYLMGGVESKLPLPVLDRYGEILAGARSLCNHLGILTFHVIDGRLHHIHGK
jgi:glycine/D-amino acid oxidase-like deaminating enzyme